MQNGVPSKAAANSKASILDDEGFDDEYCKKRLNRRRYRSTILDFCEFGCILAKEEPCFNRSINEVVLALSVDVFFGGPRCARLLSSAS